MLLKITEIIIRRNDFKEKSAYEQLRQENKMFYLHVRRTLANVSSDYKHLIPNHTISFQNLLII